MGALSEFLKNYVVDLCKGLAVMYTIAFFITTFLVQEHLERTLFEIFGIATAVAVVLVTLWNVLALFYLP